MPATRRPTRFYPASGLLLVTAPCGTALALGSAPGSSWPRGRARRTPAFALAPLDPKPPEFHGTGHRPRDRLFLAVATRCAPRLPRWREVIPL